METEGWLPFITSVMLGLVRIEYVMLIWNTFRYGWHMTNVLMAGQTDPPLTRAFLFISKGQRITFYCSSSSIASSISDDLLCMNEWVPAGQCEDCARGDCDILQIRIITVFLHGYTSCRRSAVTFSLYGGCLRNTFIALPYISLDLDMPLLQIQIYGCKSYSMRVTMRGHL
jgi:hypothetical protein